MHLRSKEAYFPIVTTIFVMVLFVVAAVIGYIQTKSIFVFFMFLIWEPLFIVSLIADLEYWIEQ